MHIRPYRDTDWEMVCEIYDAAKPDEMRGVIHPSAIPPLAADPDMLALFRDSRILLMEDANEIVGFSGSRDNSITWLFVHPRHRRKGIARALVLAVVAQLRGPVTLHVAMCNEAAYSLYLRVGFTVEREFIGQFHGHPCPAAKLRYEQAA